MIISLKHFNRFHDENRILSNFKPPPQNNHFSNDIFAILKDFNMNNWILFTKRNEFWHSSKKTENYIKMLAFYLFSTRKDDFRFIESLKHLQGILEKFDFFEFYKKEIFDQKKLKAVVLRFLKIIDVDKETRKLLGVFYKNNRNFVFLEQFIRGMIDYYPEYLKIMSKT